MLRRGASGVEEETMRKIALVNINTSLTYVMVEFIVGLTGISEVFLEKHFD